MAEYPAGLDPYAARQHLLHHTYSPLISIQSSYNADLFIQLALDNSNVSFLQFIKPYGNNAKYTSPGQAFKITNTQLITKTYPSFPIRFELSLPELLSITRANAKSAPATSIEQLFSISSLELLLKHRSNQNQDQNQNQNQNLNLNQKSMVGNIDDSLYLEFFTKIITSNKIVPFETFNHPISQIFVIDYHTDTMEDLRKFIVEFRNFNFPRYFQLDDLLIHCFILYDPSLINSDEILEFQNLVRKNLSVSSSTLPISRVKQVTEDADTIDELLTIDENSTIEEDLQRISLKQGHDMMKVPPGIDQVVKKKIYEFINKNLIPHMERKIRIWDDLVLSPKKSITGRFFSVSKIFFNSNGESSTSSSTSSSGSASSSFNHNENYYHKSSPEQVIRKLADWSLILKDFKYAYSTYDLIKKDYTHDKAWLYVAATQEICVVSLLLAQTQQLYQLSTPDSSTPPPPDRNTFRKIRHDIIEPYCDNLMYTFKSRFNLKSYGIKAIIIFIELLLCLSIYQNNSWWWNDLIEKYLYKCIDEFEKHFLNGGQAIRALLYERLGYSFGKCIYLGQNEIQTWIESRTETKEVGDSEEDGFYVNPNKIKSHSVHFAGLTKFRKSSLWYLLSIKEWLELKNYKQVEILLVNIQFSFNIDDLGKNWYDREDVLLGIIKRNKQLTERVKEEISGEDDNEDKNEDNSKNVSISSSSV